MTRTKQKLTLPSTGDLEVRNEYSGITRFGWQNIVAGDEDEGRVGTSLVLDLDCSIIQAGERGQSFDIEIISGSQIEPGRYEVKSLWRKNDNCKFDRRFKCGQRGEKIYGRRDAEIKSFALALDAHVDVGLSEALEPEMFRHHLSMGPQPIMTWVDEMHDFVDKALARQHSKSFHEKLMRWGRSALLSPMLFSRAQAIVSGGISSVDIMRGFSGLKGIFIVAGHNYSLVRPDEFDQFLAFDSASAEGPKLVFLGVLPLETKQRTVKKKRK